MFERERQGTKTKRPKGILGIGSELFFVKGSRGSLRCRTGWRERGLNRKEMSVRGVFVKGWILLSLRYRLVFDTVYSERTMR